MNDDTLVHNICLVLSSVANFKAMFLNGFSIGNIGAIFEVAYLPAGGSYWSTFCCIASGILGGFMMIHIFCREAILPEVIKEIATTNVARPYYSY